MTKQREIKETKEKILEDVQRGREILDLLPLTGGLSKREEIREGIAEYIFKAVNQFCDEDTEAWKLVAECVRQHNRAEADGLLQYLHSQGVVIKVDRELPENEWITQSYKYCAFGDLYKGCVAGFDFCQHKMLDAGYVAVEPLIKEG